ncbi:MAG TPA: phosphatase PAP2 family protein [Longimicrobiaceae bacterium]|nr:phosphatase PAP2 family protein [Longimicrobiaceae bacterium]
MAAWLLRIHHHDERALHALVLRRRPTLDRAMHAVTRLGDAAVTVALTLALLLGAVPGAQAAGRRAAFALVASHLAVQLLKRTIARARPSLPVECASLARAPDRFSFPSGHAASSLSVALGAAATLPPPLAAAAVLLAGVVGLSRCYLGVHYPGDVAVGWLLAAAAALAAPLVPGMG